MKKYILIISLILIVSEIKAQIKAGIHGGSPVGDAEGLYNSSWGINGYYMFGKERESLLKFGAGAGWLKYSGDEINLPGGTIEVEDASFLTIYSAARVYYKMFFTGVDIGYGFGLSDRDGGFHWKPVLGVVFLKILEANLFYHSIASDDTNVSSLGLGLHVKL
ncbi:hypothetical protein OO013_02545 [Mangrovivirga sp. M17]|uniref:Outer membrane protein beta-barrel domain-containing protein n=1 Tax=Mangrovivirga halotolerans TaxID=2993936 RepID=A0ABT3RMD6_9BACT|nr:hypothetical protein [Mangrovivirga halotolerans]MCX2742725.1 hypothetical protein [Mangrovivirga halotolerans]